MRKRPALSVGAVAELNLEATDDVWYTARQPLACSALARAAVGSGRSPDEPLVGERHER